MMINSILFEIVENYFKNINPGGQIWIYKHFYSLGFIPEDQLEKARLEYANYDQKDEKPILLILDTLKKDAQGVLFTNINLYYGLRSSISKTKATLKKVPLDLIDNFAINYKIIGSNLQLNGKRVAYLIVPSENEVSIINEIVNLMVTALQPINKYLNNINSGQKIILKIRKLEELRNSGAITEVEFQEKKQQLLSRL